MKPKIALLLAMFFNLFFLNAQISKVINVPFSSSVIVDPETIDPFTLWNGFEKVSIDGINYLKVNQDGWNNWTNIPEAVIPEGATHLKFQAKFEEGNSGLPLDRAITVFKLYNYDWSFTFSEGGGPASTVFKEYQMPVYEHGMPNILQAAVMDNSDWSGVTGAIQYIGKIEAIANGNANYNLSYGSAGSEKTIQISSVLNWTITSDQSWLTLNKTSGTGTDIVTLTAVANSTDWTRNATVTIHTDGYDDQYINISQYSVISVTAGGLKTMLADQLDFVTGFKLTGTIDARDFKTMRDDMPMLADVDLSDVTIVEYSGTEGTLDGENLYLSNAVPPNAFCPADNSGKPGLKNIVFPDNITLIGKKAFQSCTGLTSVTIPSTVTKIDNQAFLYCSGLSNITFDANSQVNFIGRYTFGFCTSLNNITLPSLVEIIDLAAFYNCYGLSEVIFESNQNLTVIGNGAFFNCSNLASFSIFQSVTSIGSIAFVGTNAEIHVDDGNPNYTDENGVLYDILKTRLMFCPPSVSGFFNIPNSVTTIAQSAFYNCTEITGFHMSSALDVIEAWAFENCTGIQSLTIPASVTYIDDYAFYNCFNLTSLIANPLSPVDLSTKEDVFFGIDKTNCILYVPTGSKAAYENAALWEEFPRISGQNLTVQDLNIIKNGDFNLVDEGTGMANFWGGYTDASPAHQIIDGVSVHSPVGADNVWQYQFSQINLTALPNVDYVFSFTAWADAERTFTVDFEDSPANSYNRYGVSADPRTTNGEGRSDWTFDITTVPTTYTFDVNFDQITETTVQMLGFMLGTSNIKVYIDDVVLISTADLDLISINSNHITLKRTPVAPQIDGVADVIWDKISAVPIGKNFLGENPTVNASWKAMYDDNNIYLLIDVQDDDHYPAWEAGDGSYWEYDQPEVFFDVNNELLDGTGPSSLGSGHWNFSYPMLENEYGTPQVNDLAAPVAWCYSLSGENYQVEYSFPFNSLTQNGGTVLDVDDFKALEAFGFDITINDRDVAKDSRDRKVWQNVGVQDESWANMDDCGTVSLGDEEINPDSVTVTFLVDMQNEVVDEAGVFVGGDWNSPISWREPIQMTADGDIYSVVIKLPKGKTINYKFRNGQNYEVVKGNCTVGEYNNRIFDVSDEDAVLDLVCFASCVDCGILDVLFEQDSLALVAFYTGTSGPFWDSNENWLAGPVSSWFGITVENNRVVRIDLNRNNLIGTLPEEIGQLTALRDLVLWGNQITGNIPEEIGNLNSLITFDLGLNNLTGTIPVQFGQLSNLQYLFIGSGSQLTGTIPSELGQLTKLRLIALDENDLSGSIPDELGNLDELTHLFLQGNQFSNLPDLSSLENLFELNCSNNQLTFSDLEPNMGITEFYYSPQGPVGQQENVNLNVGDDFLYEIVVGGENNQYQWYKDNALLESETMAELQFAALDLNDAGVYYCEVTNTMVPDLKLTSREIILMVEDNSASLTLTFNAGWNIFSSTVMPGNSDLMNVLQPMIDSGKLKKVMDETGKTIEDWGVYGDWQNEIGDLIRTEGYKINVTEPITLLLEGTAAQFPFNIPLKAGWNIISWPSGNEQDGMDVFEILRSEGKLKKVMDETGKTIEDWGVYGEWQNEINNFKPGKGYKVNVTENCTLTIYESGTKSTEIIPELMPSVHFIPAYSGNGTNHMNINFVNLSDSGIKEGDEIGIFDGDICVGSAQIPPMQTAFKNQNSAISIPVSASDGNEVVNGYSKGHPILVKLFRNGNEHPVSINPVDNGKMIFEIGSSLFVKLDVITGLEGIVNLGTSHVNCYPNPFSEELNIKIILAKDSEVLIELFNQQGKKIRAIKEKSLLTRGTHLYNWNGLDFDNNSVSPGVYLVRIVVDDELYHQKIILAD